jgi:hypothetical protein
MLALATVLYEIPYRYPSTTLAKVDNSRIYSHFRNANGHLVAGKDGMNLRGRVPVG